MQCLNINGESEAASHMLADTQNMAGHTKLDRPNSSSRPKIQPHSTSIETQLVADNQMLTADHLSQSTGPRWKKTLSFADDWIKTSIFGGIRIHSSLKYLHLASPDEDAKMIEKRTQSESQTSIIIQPAKWLSILGIETGFTLDFTRSSIQGWKHTLSTFRVVPSDALIFKFCEEGNLPAVRLLLSTVKASVKDTNLEGIQPLHVSFDFQIADFG